MRILRIILVSIAALLWHASESQIVLGGNITWECQGANQYELTFTFYRDCFGTPGDPTSAALLIYPTGCGGVPFSADLDLVSSTEISDLCATELPNSSCGGLGATPGTLQVVYSGVVTLDPGCVWDIVWNSFDWSLLFENMDPVFLQDGYIHTIIDTNQPCSDSPDILSSQLNPQVPYICLGQPYVHNSFISLPAGITCTYALVSNVTTGATNDVSVPVPGYSVPAGLTIDPVTGIISWTPGVEGYYVINIEMEVFDGANYIGTIYENMAIVVRDCSPTDTQFTIPEVTSTGSDVLLTGNNNLQVCAGDSLIFTVEATNPELFRGITLSYTGIPALPFTFVQSGVNPAIGTFSLLATPAMIGGSPYVLQIHAEDDFCPIPDIDDITVNITISPNIELLTNDTTICFGEDVNLVASGLGNNNYQWNALPGGDPAALTNNVASQLVTPDITTSYRVSAAGVPATCASSDTVTVTVALTDLTFATNSESCGNNNASIDITVLGDGSGNYNYDWTGAGTVDGIDDQSNLNGGVGISYSVTVTDNVLGCSLTESVNVGEIAAPEVIVSNDTTICSGGTATLNLNFTAGQAPFDIDFTSNPIGPIPADVIGAADPYSVNVSPAQTTTYTVVSITDAFGCNAILNEDIIVTVRNPVTSMFLPEADICVGANLVLDIDHSAAGSYSVVYSINGVNEPAVVVADNGTIDVTDPATSGTFTYDIESVSYNDAPLPACPSTDVASGSISVVVDPLPTAVLSNGGAICEGDCYNLVITLTGTGPWNVGYTIGGVAQAPLVIAAAAAPYNYNWSVCPAATSTYCITSVQDANCSNTVAGECATITVNPYPVVNFSISDSDICEGDCIDVDVTVAPAGTFTIVFTDTPNDPTFSTVNNETSPFSQQVCLNADWDCTLDSVYFTGVPQCATVLNQTISVTVNDEISVLATDTICNNIGTQYQVVYTVSGGELPYDELPGGTAGSFDAGGTIYTTALINSGVAGGSWTFSDGNDCNAVTMNMGLFSCPVLTDAGTMDLTPIVICGTGVAIGQATGQWNNDGFLDGNDQQMFILHTTSNATAGTIIATDCNDAIFGDADSPLAFGAASAAGVVVSGTTYYISSVVGDDSGVGVGGCVNLAAPNVQIAPGQPVTWYQQPVVNFTIDDTELCEGECALIDVDVTPSNPFSIEFSESPDDPGLGVAVGQNSPFNYVICPGATTDYTLEVVYITAAPQCSTLVNETITVNLNEGIFANPTDTICNNIGTQYQVVYTLSGGETPYDEAPGGGSGTFDISGEIFTTDLINSGAGGGAWTFSDVNDCNGINQLMNPYVCPVLTNSGTMNLAPLVICGGEVTPNSATAVWNNNGFLDGNDQQMFILHTTSNNTQGVIVAVDCDDAIFGDADSPLAFGAATAPGVVVSGTTYYISSVAGDGSGIGVGGCVDLTAANVQISPGEPVTWYQSATADLTAIGNTAVCEGDDVTLNVAFTGQGPWTFVYSIDGVDQPAINVPLAGNPYQFDVDVDGNYCLESVGNSPGNCNGTVSGCVDVVVNPLPTAVFDASAETCAGIDHCFEISLTGTGPWTMTIDDPDASDDTPPAINASPYQYCVGAAGPYQILTVSDDNGCTSAAASASVVLTVNALPTLQWSFSDTSFCEGTCIDLTIVSTGESTFDVDIISPDPLVTSTDLQGIGQVHTITVCEPGTYELIESIDNNGCVSAVGDDIVVVEIPTPIADAGFDLDQCVDLPTTIGTPALPGYSYSWSPATGIPPAQTDDAQPTVTIASQGQYTYTVTATVGQCSAVDEMLLTVHDLPVIVIDAADDSICFDTCTDLLASGADGYLWDASPTITTPLASDAITVCPTGDETYAVTGYEIHNTIQCESTAEISIVIGEEIIPVVDFTSEVCYQQCDGFAEFTVAGGYAPYLVNGNASLSLLDLCAGVYPFSIEDAQGCTADGSFEIIERPEEIIDLVTPANPVCFGDDTGSIEVEDADATTVVLEGLDLITDDAAPFEFFDLVAGDYNIYMTVTLPSGLQCVDTAMVTLISLSPEFTIQAPWSQIETCFGDQVCFDVDLIGGAGGLTSHWNNCPEAVDCEISTANIFCVDIVSDTTLYVYGTDANLCSTDTLSMSVNLYPDIFLNLQGGAESVEVCEYDCVDLVTQVFGGNGNVTVNWYEIPVDNAPLLSGDTLVVCPVFSSPFIDYYVIADDGCSTPVTDTIRVIVRDSPEVILSADTLEACYPDTIAFDYEINPTFTDSHICTWDPGTGLTFNYCADTTFLYNEAGTYFASITITSEYGCVSGDTLTDPIVMHGHPEVDFTWEPQPVDPLHLEVRFENLSEGEDSVRWNFYNAGFSTQDRPYWTFPDIESDDPFVVCLEAINEFGCKDTLCQDVFIENVLQVFVPNCFTPDQDGINDVFIPIVNGVRPETFKFWIFNRWGDPIFYTDIIGKAWTGESDGGEYYVPDGVYSWRMECEAIQDGDIKVFEGHVSILR